MNLQNEFSLIMEYILHSGRVDFFDV